MKKQFISTAVLAALLVAGSLLFGQKSDQRKEAHKEIRTYVQENVIPVMKTQREKLDLVLSQEEKREIDGIRAELKALRQSHKDAGPEIRQMRKEGVEPTPEQKDQMREAMKARRQLMNQAWAIADAHDNTIYNLLDEIAPRKKEWKEDLMALKEKYAPEQEGTRGGHGRQGFKGRDGEGTPQGKHRRHGARRGHGGMMKMRHLMQPVGFLLWDGTLPEKPGRGAGENGMGFYPQGSETVVYPNPASAANQVQFEVKNAGPVYISLIDQEGMVVKDLVTKNLEPGIYVEEFEIDDLRPGIYFYKIESSGNKEVKRFLIER